MSKMATGTNKMKEEKENKKKTSNKTYTAKQQRA